MARIIARCLSLSALLAGGLVFFHIRSMRSAVLWMPRLIASGLAGRAAFLGVMGIFAGLRVRDRLAVLTGLLGSGLLAGYIAQVTAESSAFDHTFGIDWRARVPAYLRTRMLPARWSWTMPPTHEPRLHRDVIYYHDAETDENLCCDIWQPPFDVIPSGLAYIYVHGGGWGYGYKDFNTRACFRQLAAQGHVVMDVDYRLCPRASLEMMLGDIKQAVVWMKHEGAAYGVNPERVVLAGGSAGAHLALLAAYTPNHPELDPPGLRGEDTSVRAVVAFYPPVNLLDLYRYGETIYDERYRLMNALNWTLQQAEVLRPDEALGEPVLLFHNLLGGKPDEVPERYKLASPLFHVGPHCPPTLLLHGAYDCVVPVSQSRVLRNALLKQGVDVALVEYPYADHGFDLAFPEASPVAQAAFTDVERFLALMS